MKRTKNWFSKHFWTWSSLRYIKRAFPFRTQLSKHTHTRSLALAFPFLCLNAKTFATFLCSQLTASANSTSRLKSFSHKTHIMLLVYLFMVGMRKFHFKCMNAVYFPRIYSNKLCVRLFHARLISTLNLWNIYAHIYMLEWAYLLYGQNDGVKC